MLCPRCRIPAFGEKCPNCGRTLRTEEKSKPEAEEPAQSPIRFDVLTSTKKANREEDLDWRFELKRRLDQHSARKKGDTTERLDEDESDLPPDPEFFESKRDVFGMESPKGEAKKEPSVFEYRLRDEKQRPVLQNPVKPEADYRAKASEEVFEKPLIRVTNSTDDGTSFTEEMGEQGTKTSEKAKMGRARKADLEPMLPMIFDAEQAPRSEEPEPDLEQDDDSQQLDFEDFSREILFSRFLAGIIDLTLPVLMALGLTFIASWILNFDIFMTETLVWVGVLALCLHLFTSLFFFATSGQTIGMYFTELKLAGEDGKQEDSVPVSGIIARVVLFLPFAVTLVGLFWALFDSQCRCLHDVLSGTQIIKQEEETNYLRRRSPLGS